MFFILGINFSKKYKQMLRVQNFAVHFVMRMHRRDHITPFLKELKRLIPVSNETLYISYAMLSWRFNVKMAFPLLI